MTHQEWVRLALASIWDDNNEDAVVSVAFVRALLLSLDAYEDIENSTHTNELLDLEEFFNPIGDFSHHKSERRINSKKSKHT